MVVGFFVLLGIFESPKTIENTPMTTPLEVIKLMESSQNAEEWNANCDKVKKANGGYPDFWYSSIVLSGVFDDTEARWKQSRPEGLPNAIGEARANNAAPLSPTTL